MEEQRKKREREEKVWGKIGKEKEGSWESSERKWRRRKRLGEVRREMEKKGRRKKEDGGKKIIGDKVEKKGKREGEEGCSEGRG